MKKIIIIDDDRAIQDSVALVFAQPEFQTTTYIDGTAILAGNFELPDIFIIDKQLPGVDGLGVCKHLKQTPEFAHIPVIIMSATPAAGKLSQAAGADGFIEKPFTLKQLRAEVNRCLSE
ncbi:MAG: response regulator [Agriterribacter sp.]